MDVISFLAPLLGWLKQTQPADAILPAVKMLVVVALAVIAFRLIRRGLNALEQREILTPPIVILLRMALKWIVVIFGVLLVLQQSGISLNSVWTTISAILTLVAVGFVAVWSILSNFLCTVMLLIFQPFRIGDEIEIIDPGVTAGVNGQVINIDMIFTLVRETDESGRETGVLQIPNNLFFQKVLRRKPGRNTIDLNEQVFEPRSLLNRGNRESDDA
jgi:small-conductance mechanosensitive channel